MATRAFEAQLDELAATRSAVLGLEAALTASRNGAAPPGAVVLTFDDGYLDNFTHAHPLLGRHGFPAVFFVATGFLGTNHVMPRYASCCDADRMMGWDDVRTLGTSGHEIGGHGRQHLELASLSEASAREEIEGCARDVLASLGERPRLFCYPRGSEAPAVRRLVADAGFLAACTVAPGANPPGQDPFGLRRTEISGDDSLQDFRLKRQGAFDAWHGLVQAFRRARIGAGLP